MDIPEAQTCVACEKLVISGQYMVLNGEIFHPECLVCSQCKEKITGPCHSKDGGRVCEECNSKVALCCACQLPVENADASSTGPFFHRECWACGSCGDQITDREFVQTKPWGPGVKPTCVSCHAKQKPQCAVCNQTITEEFLPVDGKNYHYACFKCIDCDGPITGSYSKKGENYQCQSCNLASHPQCFACNQPIHEEHPTFEGKTYHRACFCCATCSKPISGSHGRRRGDRLAICMECKEAERGGCAACGQPVLGPHLDIGDEVFHHECFKCVDCTQAISGSYFKRGNDYLCKPCEDSRAPQCGRCSKPIWTEHPTIKGVAFHYECLLCTMCGCHIAGSYFPTEDGQPTCKLCHEGQQPKCGVCEKPVFGKRVLVEGHVYHAECFVCEGCGDPLAQGEDEVQCFPTETTGGHHCKKCLEEKKSKLEKERQETLSVCAACGIKIEGPVLSLGEGEETYHPDCFKCSKCSAPISGTFTSEAEGPVCMACQPKCDICGEELAGKQCVRIGMRKVHVECAQKEGQEVPEDSEVGCASPTKRAAPSIVIEAPAAPTLEVPPQAMVRVRSVPLARSRVMHMAIGQPIMLPTASVVQPVVQLGTYAAPVAHAAPMTYVVQG